MSKIDTNLEPGFPGQVEQVSFSEKLRHYVPDPVTMLFCLTFLGIIVAVAVTGKGFENIIKFWGQGFVTGFPLVMQTMLLLLLSYAIGVTPVINKGFAAVAGVVDNQKQGVLLVAFLSIFLAFWNWGLGIIGGLALAREVTKKLAGAGKEVNYPLLLAAGCSGMLVWENGLSGLVPLYLVQANHFLVKDIGRFYMGDTVFSPLNLTVTVLLLIIVPVILSSYAHKSETAYNLEEQESKRSSSEERLSVAVRLEKSWIVSLVFGGLALLYIIRYLAAGKPMDLPNYLFMLMAIGIILRREPMDYQKDVISGVRVIWFISIPLILCGALQGVVNLSGLSQVISGWLTGISSAAAFPAITVITSAIINLLIPNASGQWMVEGAALMTAAKTLGVSYSKTILAFTYGAGWAKLLQLSLFASALGLTGVRIGAVTKYLGMVCLVSLITFILAVTVF